MKKIIIFFAILFLTTFGTNALDTQTYEKVDALLDIFYIKLEKSTLDNESRINILDKLNIKIEKITNKKPAISNNSLMLLNYIKENVLERIDYYNLVNNQNNGITIERDYLDFFTPDYYNDVSNIKNELDIFLKYVYLEKLQNPLQDSAGNIPNYTIPKNGSFGVQKGSGDMSSHHSALDFHVGNNEVNVGIYASHDGYVNTYENARKWRDYITVTKEIKDNDGKIIGKLVTLYAHVDKKLNESDGLKLDGKFVNKGDLISNNLYNGTKGGPHLHYEVRFYRSDDIGNEEFYGFIGKDLTKKSMGEWIYGKWNPNVGFGYANPANFGIK